MMFIFSRQALDIAVKKQQHHAFDTFFMETVEKIVGSDVVLFWLDEHIGKDGNCTPLKQEFVSNTTNIYIFHDVDQCLAFFKLIKNKKAFGIIQGKHAKTLVPKLLEYTTLSPTVYIFCFDTAALSDWAEDYECILAGGIFDHEKDLLGRLTRDLSDYAVSKVQEYRFKRAACEEWAQNLTKNAKRFQADKFTLTYSTDPFSDQETPCKQPNS
jgi:hypothetical protein